MSNREMIARILDELPDDKLGYVLAYLQGMVISEEAQDDFFCKRLVEEYLNDTDADKDEVFSLEDCKKEWGLA